MWGFVCPHFRLNRLKYAFVSIILKIYWKEKERIYGLSTDSSNDELISDIFFFFEHFSIFEIDIFLVFMSQVTIYAMPFHGKIVCITKWFSWQIFLKIWVIENKLAGKLASSDSAVQEMKYAIWSLAILRYVLESELKNIRTLTVAMASFR